MKLAVDGLFFDHVQKTGGTALFEWLSEWLGRENVSPMIASRPYFEVIKEFSDRALISGHCYYVPGDTLDAARFNLTVLRDPIDRVLSEYTFCRYDVPQMPGQANEFVRLAKANSFAELIELRSEAVIDRVCNAQVRHFAPLGGYVDESTTPGPLGPARLALHGFDLVGTQERLGELTQVLGACLGMSPERSGGVRRVKASSRRLGRGDLDARTLARIEELNAGDRELYEFARSLEEEQLRALRELSTQYRAPMRLVRRARGGSAQEPAAETAPQPTGRREIEVLGVEIAGDISRAPAVSSGEMVEIRISLRSDIAEDALTVGIRIVDAVGRVVHGTNTRLLGHNLAVQPGDRAIVVFRSRLDIGNGEYFVDVSLHRGHTYGEGTFHIVGRAASMQVLGTIGSHFEGYARLPMSCAIEGIAATTIRLATRIVLDAPCLVRPVASIEILSAPATVRTNEVFTIDACVHNLGDETWPSEGVRRMVLSYKWIDPASGRIVVEEGDRTLLPRDLLAGEQLRIPVLFRAPAATGPSIAEVRLLQERCAWLDAAARREITLVD